MTDEKGRSIEEIRDEMSKEYHDLRTLLQETSTQLKQVLDDKSSLGISEEGENTDGHGKNFNFFSMGKKLRVFKIIHRL